MVFFILFFAAVPIPKMRNWILLPISQRLQELLGVVSPGVSFRLCSMVILPTGKSDFLPSVSKHVFWIRR